MKSPDDRGSGTVLGLAVSCGAISLLLLLVPLAAGMSTRQRVAEASDAAALAGADVATGIAPGYPCEVAGVIAEANGSTLVACVVDGLVVTVRSKAPFLGISIEASATAGPPGTVTN